MKSKKTLFLVLICAMLLACIGVLAGCGGSASDEPDSPLVGTYELTQGIYSGVTVDTADLGMTSTIEFKNSGKGEITISDEDGDAGSDLTYTFDGTTVTIDIDGDEETATISEDYSSLTFENFFETGVDFIYTRQ